MVWKKSVSGLKSCVSACIVAVTVLAVVGLSGCGSSSKPLSIAVTASSTTVDGADSVTLTATVASDKNAAGVTWGASGGGTLSNTTTTSATYTAPAATSSAQTITITATSVTNSAQTGTVTITVPAAPAVTSTSTSLTGTVGTPYSITLQASGGIPPYTWALAGSSTLPSCLTLKSSGVITTASGTAPTASCAGTYSNLTFTVTDSGTPTPLTATSAALNITIAAATPITFTGTVPATGTYGVAYTGSATASGGAGPLTYSISAGALPADLSLNASSGAITGMPNKSTDVGTFNFTVKASDAYGDSNSQAYSIVVSYAAVTVNTTTPPTGYANSVYTTTTLTATGGNGGPYTWGWAAASGSSLPPGLSLSTSGAITGTPTATGTYMVVATATDSATNSGHATLAITVKAGVSITTSTTLPTGYVGSNYSQQLAATGGSGSGFTWTVKSGSTLPAGLTLSSSGLLSGAPTTAGTPSFTLTVTDSAGNTANATFSMTISPGVNVVAPALASGYPGTPYTSAAFTASGGTNTGFTWSWAAASGSTLPSGLNISSSTGVISGTPVNSGSSSVKSTVVVTATDSVGNKGSATVSVTIEATVAITTPTSLPGATVGVSYSRTLAASGGSGTYPSWQLTAGASSLAAVGLSFNTTTGVVSGTTPSAGTATFTVTVTDSESHVSAAVTFTVSVNTALKVDQTTLPPGDAGSSYSQTLTASGGSGSGYTFTATSSNLSAFGLTLSSAGAITGTLSQSGSISFTANVKDSNNNTATQALTITVYSALALPAPNPSSLPAGYTNVAYTGSVSGSGGSGTLSASVISALSPANGTLTTSVSGATVNVTGTPSSAATESFTVKLTDSTTGNSISQTYTISITTPTAVVLPTPNPSSLPSATVNQSYSGTINASGGVPPYTWSINGSTVTSGGLSLSNGLSASSTGGSTLSISGTPTTTTSVTLTNVKVTDNVGSNATQTYTIAVNSAGSQVSGQILLTNYCGSGSPTLPTFSVSINTNPVQTVQTDSNGNYSFASVPNGTYTITPSYSGPTGSSSVFYPATFTNIVVNNNAVTGENFDVALGYTVSGTIAYSGALTGRIYVNLVGSNCGGNSGSGTSIASAGPFTIHGVSPGSYALQAWMDISTLNAGAQNEADPTGSGSGTVTVSTANLTGQNVTLADPTSFNVGTSGPNVKSISPIDQGLVVSFGKGSVSDNNGVEEYTSYTIQWSTSTLGFSSSQQVTFKAIGPGTNVWIVRNGDANMTGTLANGTGYYFRVRGSNASGNSPWTTSPSTVTIGAPSSGANTVTGTITIPSTVTINSGAVLYAGLYDQSTNTAYAEAITSPSNSSGNNFTVYVPTGSNYILFGILDQNKDGLIDAGDVANVRNNNAASIAVSGNLSGQNATLPDVNAPIVVQTQFTQDTYFNGTSSNTSSQYGLNFNVREGNKLPVAVQLVSASNPNVITPVDISNYCQGCGSVQFDLSPGIGPDVPVVNDSYTFQVTYSDGTKETLTGKVTAALGTSALTTNLEPEQQDSTSLTPTFTWTYPTNASNYVYSFYICCGSSGTIWQIPGNNSNSNGFPSTVTQIVWGTDPTGDTSNTPNPSSLTLSTQYNWAIQTMDSNGNSATNMVWYMP